MRRLVKFPTITKEKVYSELNKSRKIQSPLKTANKISKIKRIV